jgi:hypothetical protein
MDRTLETAKASIINALNDFDVGLGRRAFEVLSDERRLNIVEVDKAKTSMMACRPAGITIDDLKSMNMHIPDFVDEFGEPFTQQDNPEDYAIIDFEYDGTNTSLVYLAHELGHAIADDIQREAGRSFRDFSEDQLEKQAYFVQKIVTHHMERSVHDDCKQGNLGGIDPLKDSFDRMCQQKSADIVFQEALSAKGAQRGRIIVDLLGGGQNDGALSPNLAPNAFDMIKTL